MISAGFSAALSKLKKIFCFRLLRELCYFQNSTYILQINISFSGEHEGPLCS